MFKFRLVQFSAALVFSAFLGLEANAAIPGDPPDISADANREGFAVQVVGTIADESPDTVTLTLKAGGGPGFSIPVEVVDGRFSIEIELGVNDHFLTLEAIDEEGLKDKLLLEIPF